jgi:hypothetical protein
MVNILAEDEDEYIGVLLNRPESFDIIIVDGGYRDRCIRESINKLTMNGILIIDNSDWLALASSLEFLLNTGFRKLEFYSLGPVNGHPWGSSIFYRDSNIFNI